LREQRTLQPLPQETKKEHPSVTTWGTRLSPSYSYHQLENHQARDTSLDPFGSTPHRANATPFRSLSSELLLQGEMERDHTNETREERGPSFSSAQVYLRCIAIRKMKGTQANHRGNNAPTHSDRASPNELGCQPSPSPTTWKHQTACKRPEKTPWKKRERFTVHPPPALT